MICVFAGLGFAVLSDSRFLQGQPPEGFDVASIRPNSSGSTRSGEHTSHGTLTVTNDSVRELIKFAYDLKDYQISGGPGWLDTNRYDIVAKIGRDIGDTDLKLLTQSLLVDRFKLRVRREKRLITAYSLIIAKAGPRLSEHTGEGQFSSETTFHSLRAAKATTATLAGSLSRVLGWPVTDNTGLRGMYDY